jgi:membrane protein required for colicin V production
MENMTTLDVGIVAIVILLGLKGFFNGLFKELFGLIGIVGGVFVGTRLGYEAGIYINDNLLHLENPSVISVTGFLATLIIFWVGMTILGNFLSMLSSKSGLGGINRLLGFAFASVKIFLIFAVITHALLNVKVVADSMATKTEGSIVVPYLQEAGAYIVNADFSAIVTKAEEKSGFDLDETISKVKEALPSTEEISTEVNEQIEKVVEEKLSTEGQ